MAGTSLTVLVATFHAVTGAAADPPRRARPPEWSAEQRALFSDDARELLVGPRPDFGGEPPADAPGDAGPEARGDGSGSEWSRLITAETIETEVKRQSNAIARLVQSPTAFKGGGYRGCRDAFSVLAVMFAITAEHDGEPRWRDRAAGLAVLFARAGANCKVGTDASYRSASLMGEALAELVRGGRPETPRVSDEAAWGSLADRSPLMRRMEVAQQDQLAPLMGRARDFSRGAEKARHEAEVLAALAEVITRDGFEDADDEDYVGLAESLRNAASDLSRAADSDTYEAARAALGRVDRSCSDCHENYRG